MTSGFETEQARYIAMEWILCGHTFDVLMVVVMVSYYGTSLDSNAYFCGVCICVPNH